MEKRKQLDEISEEKSDTSEENPPVDNRDIKHKVSFHKVWMKSIYQNLVKHFCTKDTDL